MVRDKGSYNHERYIYYYHNRKTPDSTLVEKTFNGRSLVYPNCKMKKLPSENALKVFTRPILRPKVCRLILDFGNLPTRGLIRQCKARDTMCIQRMESIRHLSMHQPSYHCYWNLVHGWIKFLGSTTQ